MFGEPKMAGNVWFFLISSFGETSVAGRLRQGGKKIHPIINSCDDVFVSCSRRIFLGIHLPPHWRLCRGSQGIFCQFVGCKELGEENQAGKTKKQKKDKYMLHSLNLSDTYLVHMNFPSPFFLVSEKLRWRSCKRTLHIWLKEKNTFKAAPTSTGPGTSTMLVMLGISGVDFFGGAPDTWHQ